MDRLETLSFLFVEKNMSNLHSSMDRLETNKREQKELEKAKFTFQYGQIRNKNTKLTVSLNVIIYIPVWIDQKLI